MNERETFEGWAFLELMGHRKLAGYLREASIGGGSFIRIDVPAETCMEGNVATQFYAPAAVYAITPTTEEMARRYALRCKPAPVEEWELPKRPALPAAPLPDADPNVYDDEAEDGDLCHDCGQPEPLCECS